MSYKIIEKNEYGIRVRNYSGIRDCNLCKYVVEKSTCKRSECAPNSYYLPDSEVERLESENQLMNTTIDDLYIESKCYFEVKKKLDDTQKELIDLQIENKQLKERITELEGENEWISVEDELPKQITYTVEDEENGNTLYFYEHYAVKGYFENKAKTESTWIGVYRPCSVGWYFQVIKPQKTVNFIITHWKHIN